MNGSGVLALICQAYAALPDGTVAERTAWVQQKRREMESQPPSERHEPVARSFSGPKPFAHVADHPAVKRAGSE